MKLPLLISAGLMVTLLAGCDTFEHRSHQMAPTFASLTPGQRDKLKHGVIEIGDTPDMVYIALGHPDEKHEKSTAGGGETVWVYNSYDQEYEGDYRTGYHRMLFYDPARRHYTVFFDPVYTDVYSEHVEERIRITFKNGHVAAIEQPKVS